MDQSLLTRCLEKVASYAHGYSLQDFEELPTILLEHLPQYLSAAELLRLRKVFLKYRVSTDEVWEQLIQKCLGWRPTIKTWMAGRPSHQVYLVCFYHMLLQAPKPDLLQAYKIFLGEGVNGTIDSLPVRLLSEEMLQERLYQDLLKYASEITHLSLFPRQVRTLLQLQPIMDLLTCSLTHLKVSLIHQRSGRSLQKFCSYMLTHGRLESVCLKGRLNHSDAEGIFKILAGGCLDPDVSEHISDEDSDDNNDNAGTDNHKLHWQDRWNPVDTVIKVKALRATCGGNMDRDLRERSPGVASTISACRGINHLEIQSMGIEHLGSLLSSLLKQSKYLYGLELNFPREGHLQHLDEWDGLLDTLLECLLNGHLLGLVTRFSQMFTSPNLLHFLCALAERYTRNEPINTLHIEESGRLFNYHNYKCSTFDFSSESGQNKSDGRCLVDQLPERQRPLVKDFKLTVDHEGVMEFTLWMVKHNTALTRLQLHVPSVSYVSISSEGSLTTCPEETVSIIPAISLLMQELQGCPQLEVLDLSNMEVRWTDLISLGHALPHMKSLTSLILANCGFQFRPKCSQGIKEGLDVFCCALRCHPNLRQVNLAQNCLGKHGVALLRYVLFPTDAVDGNTMSRTNSQLDSLDLSHNFLPNNVLLELGQEMASQGTSNQPLNASRDYYVQRLDLRGVTTFPQPQHQGTAEITRLFSPFVSKLVMFEEDNEPLEGI